MNKQAVIVADGEFPTHKIPLEAIKAAKFLVCCDGAINQLDARKIVPDLIVGDLDSADPKLLDKYKTKTCKSDCQDTNDLTKAVNWLLDKNFEEIVIVGACGKREDHTLGNFSLLFDYCQKIKVSMLTDHGKFSTATKSTTFESFAGQQVSIFSINQTLKITSENLKYPLRKTALSSLWCGTLNESTAENFTLLFDESGQIVVYQLF